MKFHGLLASDEIELIFRVAWPPRFETVDDPDSDVVATWHAVDVSRGHVLRAHASRAWNQAEMS